MGQYVWPVYQTAAAFSQAYEHIFGQQRARCLVVYGIDQDPYFRLGRDVAPGLKYLKPCAIMSKFLPALKGDEKMSATGDSPTIFLTDTEKQIERR